MADNAEKDVSVDLVAGIRCQAIHGQIVGASCVNCRSWAEQIGVPFWAPLLAEFALISVTPPAECNGMCVMDETGYAVEHPHPGCPAHGTRVTSPEMGKP